MYIYGIAYYLYVPIYYMDSIIYKRNIYIIIIIYNYIYIIIYIYIYIMCVCVFCPYRFTRLIYNLYGYSGNLYGYSYLVDRFIYLIVYKFIYNYLSLADLCIVYSLSK